MIQYPHLGEISDVDAHKNLKHFWDSKKVFHVASTGVCQNPKFGVFYVFQSKVRARGQKKVPLMESGYIFFHFITVLMK